MLSRIARRVVADWFLVGMVSAVILASLLPGLGASGGTLHIDKVSDLGIFLIFMLHGLALSTESMKRGLARWPLHLTVQATTFIIFPLLFLVFRAAFNAIVPSDLMLGFLYLCALPSTISSSVAMTSAARGNVPAAVFNATISNLLGIFLTPLIISLMMATQGGSLSLTRTVVNVATLLLLPFVAGQLTRPVFGALAERYKKAINNFDKGVVLLLVYGSFCESVKSGLWSRYGIGTLFITIAGAAVILAVILTFNIFAARWLGFNKEDEITAVMCGSKKTLAAGVPMAKLLFAGSPILGLIVLPIMFYHQLQLFTCAVLAERYARRKNRGPNSDPAIGMAKSAV